jgi:hypothetical protein
MPDMIKVPGVGPVKPVYVYAGVGVIGGIVIYAYWRRGQAGSEVTDSTATDTTDTTDTGTEAEPGYDYSLGAGGYDYGTGTSYPVYQYPSTGSTIVSSTPTTNAEWAQAAKEELENEGVDSGQASGAIGNYLARLCLSSTQADLVRRAAAMVGNPPQGTFNITTCPGTPAGGGTTSGPTGPFGHITVSSVGRTTAVLTWPGVAHADGYTIYKNGARTQSVKYGKYSVANMHPNTSYTIKIVPIPEKGFSVGPSGSVTFRTKK